MDWDDRYLPTMVQVQDFASYCAEKRWSSTSSGVKVMQISAKRSDEAGCYASVGIIDG